jgi:hypothetical protein
MDERTMRAMIAENVLPAAIAGRIRWLSHGQKPSDSGA